MTYPTAIAIGSLQTRPIEGAGRDTMTYPQTTTKWIEMSRHNGTGQNWVKMVVALAASM